MPDLLYEVQGHLARITMNRPEHLNCFSEEMIHLWTAALEDIRDRDDIYAVLLSGNGKAFCAGGDVKAMAAGDGFFESRDEVPRHALSMGIKNIMNARRILIIVSGEEKADIVKEAFSGPVTKEVPASVLQLHPDVTLVGDKAALHKLVEAGVPVCG